MDFSLNDLLQLGALRGFVETFPTLVYGDETLSIDFECEFHLRNQQELEEVLARVKERFRSAIRDYDYLVYTQVLKYARFPGPSRPSRAAFQEVSPPASRSFRG